MACTCKRRKFRLAEYHHESWRHEQAKGKASGTAALQSIAQRTGGATSLQAIAEEEGVYAGVHAPLQPIAKGAGETAGVHASLRENIKGAGGNKALRAITERARVNKA